MSTMKWALVFVLLLSFQIPGMAQTAQPSSGRADDEQAIRKLHEAWLKAYDTGDAEALDRVEDDDFTVAGEFGERTKQQQLNSVRHRTEKSEAVNRKADPQRIRFYGDVALLTEIDHTSTAEGADEFQSTEVWVRTGSTWKVVHLHFSHLAKQP
jgi:ketosteroid isomerase-like protein